VRTANDGTLRDSTTTTSFSSSSTPPPRPSAICRAWPGVEIDVDLGLATPRDLAVAPPTLFWYELGEAHRLLWSRPGDPPHLPRIRVGDLDPAEGSRLLLNRGLALVWAGARLWSGPCPGSGSVTGDPAELRFATIAAHKAVSAAGDAALLRGSAYTPSQSDRHSALLEPSRSPRLGREGFLDAYARAVAFRRQPAPVALAM
jgi:hypothetical protein